VRFAILYDVVMTLTWIMVLGEPKGKGLFCIYSLNWD